MKNTHKEKYDYDPNVINEINITEDMEQNFNQRIMEILG